MGRPGKSRAKVRVNHLIDVRVVRREGYDALGHSDSGNALVVMTSYRPVPHRCRGGKWVRHPKGINSMRGARY